MNFTLPLFRVARMAGVLVAAATFAAPLAAPTPVHAQNTDTAQFLQLGSFKNANNARKMLSQFTTGAFLDGAVNGFVDQRMVGSELYHRVRIGPIYTEQLAQRALNEAHIMGIRDAKLTRQDTTYAVLQPNPNFSGPVTDYNYNANMPTASTPVSLPTTSAPSSMVRYLDIGSYTDLTQATKQLDRARAAGFGVDGTIHTLGVRGGAVHRVLVGPFGTDAAAAQIELGLLNRGIIAAVAKQTPHYPQTVQPQTVQPIVTPNLSTQSTPGDSYLHVGSFRMSSNAHAALDHLRRHGLDNDAYGIGFIDQTNVNGETYFRVQFGPMANVNSATQALSHAQILGYKDARIARLTR